MPLPTFFGSKPDAGFGLVLVMLVGGLLSLLALVFVEYGRWGQNVRGTSWHLYKQHQALRLADRQVRDALETAVADTGYLEQPLQRRWELPPEITVEARAVSLNGRFNLNVLNRAGLTESYRSLLERVLVELGYPERSDEELIRWIEPSGELDVPSVDRYGGYSYRAPGRPFHHLDELELVSGFIQRGIQPPLRSMLTVHGSGNVNVYHLTPARWRLLSSASGVQLPPVPPEALRSQDALVDYLTQPGRWDQLKQQFPFLSREDDAFRADYRIRSGGHHLRVRIVYERSGDGANLRTVTRYALNGPSSTFSSPEVPVP